MNAYYNEFTQNNTVGLPSENAKRRRTSHALTEKLLSLTDALIAALTSSKVLNIIRVTVTVITLFTLIGIIGGIERGLISWGMGLIISVLLAVVEAFCIKRCKK